jgi:hypothetical protein
MAAHEVDIGERIDIALRQVADKTGATVEHVFPWYVKQQVIEGSGLLLGATVCFVITARLAYKQYARVEENVNKYLPTAMAYAFAAIVSGLVLALSGNQLLSKILNPEYHALTNMIADLAKLL